MIEADAPGVSVLSWSAGAVVDAPNADAPVKLKAIATTSPASIPFRFMLSVSQKCDQIEAGSYIATPRAFNPEGPASSAIRPCQGEHSRSELDRQGPRTVARLGTAPAPR